MNKLILFFICSLQFGCNYSLSKVPLNFRAGSTSLEEIPAGKVVSYSLIASAIIQPKCLECHGDAGGINLESYANVAGNLGIIKSEVESNKMPKNRPKLTAKEKQILLTWIDAGGPENEITKTPATPPIPQTPSTPPTIEFINYEMVNAQVIRPRCLSCHSEVGGNRGNVNLETYENVVVDINSIESAIKSGAMPRPKNRPLTEEQKSLILKWIVNGSPKN